jgi:hypothetical protein
MPEFLRVVEVLTGLFYLTYGLDGFIKKLPLPVPSEKAKEFLLAIEKTGFILPTVKTIEIVSGLCFIFAFQAPLAWCFLSPVVFNILGYQVMLNKRERLFPLLMLILHLLLLFKYFPIFERIWS